ncbi:MAG: leucine-rich repeat protein, partial [Lachnospiraceae bacterium]|nr:leucine-rich repeat protein [Lachnospiraceae bacterium]
QPKTNTTTVKKGTKFTTPAGTYIVTSTTTKKESITFVRVRKTSIKSLTIPDTVKYKNVTYKVKAIQAKAVKGCTKLTKVTIGKNVTAIGSNAFYKCKKLKSIVFRGKNAPSIGKNAFKSIASKAVFKVPRAVSTKQWNAYKKKLTSKTGFQKKKMKLKKS